MLNIRANYVTDRLTQPMPIALKFFCYNHGKYTHLTIDAELLSEKYFLRIRSGVFIHILLHS